MRAIDADAHVTVTALDAHLRAMTGPTRVAVGVAGLIGLLALAVAAVGIHGVIAYTVALRTREIGLHQALGARPAQVLHLVFTWTLRGVLMGTTGALFCIAAFTLIFGGRLREGLNGLHRFDPVSFLLVVSTLVVVIGLAAYVPARRALGMVPLAALRRE